MPGRAPAGFVVSVVAFLAFPGGRTVAAAPRPRRPAPAVVVTAGLPRATGNVHYEGGNRAPLLPSPLVKLPLGSVKAEGWLATQLALMAEGFTGRLPELSRFCRFEGNAWTDPKGEGGFGWEEVPYWLKGFVDLGHMTGDKRIQAESRRWLEAVMATRQASGYFGGRTNLADAESGTRVLDLWPNMVMLYPLRSHYEATGDRRVLDLMTRYFRWQSTLPLDALYPGSWQKWRAADNLDSIHWLYNRTGERWLLDLARVNHERTADWAGDFPTWHGVNLAQCFRGPAQYYPQTRDARYLQAAERVYDTAMALYGQLPGGGFAADENARPGFSGPRQGTETCAFVELMHSHEMLVRITGDPKWADRAEDVAFNSLPATMTPDLKGLHYLTAANQVVLDRRSKAPLLDNGGDMLSYSPWQYRCCQHNVAFGWPYFVGSLWAATGDNGLAAVLYAPARVRARVGRGVAVDVEVRTGYPFDDTVEITLKPAVAVRFPLALRLPAWAKAPTVAVNRAPLAIPGDARGWVTLERQWQPGDQVLLTLPMEVRLRRWARNQNAVSVDRGPLTYSLAIPQRWDRYNDDERWPAFEVFPQAAWNYGLDLDSPIEVAQARIVPGEQPFTLENAPVVLRAKGRRIPQWGLEANGLVGELQPSPALGAEPLEDLALVPMGCARLRISAFPEVKAEGAAPWHEAPPLATASSAGHFAPPTALNDGRVGRSSGDLDVPRFLWWDRYGSLEWAQYAFPRPREVSWVEVYWADEEVARSSGRVPHDLRLSAPTDGRVRLPASWRLLYWDGAAWQPAAEAAEHGIARDQWNRVSFRPVVTTALRLEAQLRPRQSAGIVEWRVGP
jgi:DUF1680 family protein